MSGLIFLDVVLVSLAAILIALIIAIKIVRINENEHQSQPRQNH